VLVLDLELLCSELIPQLHLCTPSPAACNVICIVLIYGLRSITDCGFANLQIVQWVKQ